MQIDLNLKVSALLTSEGEWNSLLLHRLFPPEDVIKIQSFPLQQHFLIVMCGRLQRMVNTVKSGTRFLTNETAAGVHIPEDVRAVNEIKTCIWDTHTEPKIRMFICRTLSGALAVAECIRNHGIQVNPVCQECRAEEETIVHVLFECTLETRVWSASLLPLPPQGCAPTVAENVQYLLQLMNRGEIPANLRNAIPWLLWEIWKARNVLVFSGRTQDPHVLIATALESAEVWLCQHAMVLQDSNSAQQRFVPRLTRWSKPAAGVLKCNVHCAWVNDTYYCDGAWILRNDAWNVQFHARDAFLPRMNRISAKLSCILCCLQSLSNLQVHSCELWSDCHVALEALEFPLEWPKYRSQIGKIAGVIQAMGEVTFKLSSPKANLLAREIAHSVTRDGRLTSYLALGGPLWLHDRIEEDRAD